MCNRSFLVLTYFIFFTFRVLVKMAANRRKAALQQILEFALSGESGSDVTDPDWENDLRDAFVLN